MNELDPNRKAVAAANQLAAEKMKKKKKRGMSVGGIVAVVAIPIVLFSLIITFLPVILGLIATLNYTEPDDPIVIVSSDVAPENGYNFRKSDEKAGNSPLKYVEFESGEKLSHNEIYTKICPSVVRIFTSSSVDEKTGYSASGFIISEDGYILTNAHVVADTAKVEVVTYDEKTFEAKVIGFSEPDDVALIRINAYNLTPAVLGDSDEVLVGDDVSAVGGPASYALSYTMTHGIISGIRNGISFDGGEPVDLIQTDTPINGGNSGSPLINDKGAVIAINFMKLYSTSYVPIENMSFAIPINTAKKLARDFVSYGRKLGTPAFGFVECTYEEEVYGRRPAGVRIGGTIEGSDAEDKGFQAGDIITHLNGEEIESLDHFIELRDKLSAFDIVDVTYFRNESGSHTVSLKLGEFY